MAKAATGRSLIGSKIGNYSIVSTLGEGGMGVVYLAEHPQIGKQVAIKVLHPDHAARSDAAARCFLEARAVNEIRHPNVVDIIDCGTVELGGGDPETIYYLLMEYLDGCSLRARLREGPIPPDRAIEIAHDVATALAAAHAKGIIHRDIKPENIFLCREGERETVKLLDFGIAKLIDGHGMGERLTRSGVALGTPQYMAPEQLDAEDVDGRADVYALGIVFYEMIAGAAPFANETTARGVWRRMNEVPALTDEQRALLPGNLADVLLRTLDPDRIRRPDMAELVRALDDPATELASPDGDRHTKRVAKQAVSRPAAERARPEPTAMTVEDQLPSRRPLVIVGAVTLLVIVAIVIIMVVNRWQPPASKPTEPAVTPAAAIVTYQVDSSPPGAEVFVGTEPAARGKTPVAIRLPKNSGVVALRIVRAGYQEVRRSIDTLTDGNLTELLVAPDKLVRDPRPLPPTTSRPVIRKAPPDAGVAAAPDAAVPAEAPPRTPRDGGLGTGLKDPN